MISHSLSYYKVILLIPSIDTEDENLKYYYDFSQSKAEYDRVFSELQIEWIWLELNSNNIVSSISNCIELYTLEKCIFFNLCDGDEINGAPGIEVIKYLEKCNAIFTGSHSLFYYLTTSKIVMKERFDELQIATPHWQRINKSNAAEVIQSIGVPMIIKPAVSGGSMGVSVRNVVHSVAECLACIDEIEAGYRGWNLVDGGIIAEEFIVGREFTTLIVGNSQNDKSIRLFNAVERKFNEILQEEEKFLSFDRLWETYETESEMPENGHFFEYHKVDHEFNETLNQLTKDAYSSLLGSGYSRIDIRQRSTDGKLFVLEVNAQCGISEDENFTSIGAILRVSKISFTELCRQILEDTLINHHSYIYESMHTSS